MPLAPVTILKLLPVLLALRSLTTAQNTLITHEEIPLWPNGAPNAQGTAPEDIPTLTLYPVTGDGTAPTAILICPGGGYGHLSMSRMAQQTRH